MVVSCGHCSLLRHTVLTASTIIILPGFVLVRNRNILWTLLGPSVTARLSLLILIAVNGLPWWLSGKEPACQSRR